MSRHVEVDSSGKNAMIRRADVVHPQPAKQSVGEVVHPHPAKQGQASALSQTKHPHAAKKGQQSALSQTKRLQADRMGSINWKEKYHKKPGNSEGLVFMGGYGYSEDLKGTAKGEWLSAFSYYFRERDECMEYCFGNGK